MKLKVSKQELNECLNNAFNRVLSEASRKGNPFDKATKSANRDVERKYRGEGFKSYDKAHRSPKDYSRKGKNKFYYNDGLDEAMGVNTDSPYDDNIYDDGYDTSLIPDVNDLTNGSEMSSGDEVSEPTVFILTDLDSSERDIIEDVLDNFEGAKEDVVSGHIAFEVPKRIATRVKVFLRDNEVEIIKNKE